LSNSKFELRKRKPYGLLKRTRELMLTSEI